MTESVERGAQSDDNEAGIARLVEGLFSLTEGELSVAALVGIGERAVPAESPSVGDARRCRLLRWILKLRAETKNGEDQVA